MTGRVSFCTFNIQQCVHMPSFLMLETEFQTYLSESYKNIETP